MATMPRSIDGLLQKPMNWEMKRRVARTKMTKTIADWCGEKSNALDNSPPESRQHFDVWSFTKADNANSSYFGRMPPQIVENLLWFYTDPGSIVFDPFAGGGTTIDVCKAMGRRVWSSDRKPSTPTLPARTLPKPW